MMQEEIKKAGKVIPINALVATRKIKKFLNSKEPELVFFLQTLWKNQGKAITYKELREAILDGYLSEKLMEEWYQDYSRFVIEKVAPLWQEAMKAANEPFTDAMPKYIFNPMQENVVKWTNDRAAAFVTSVTRDQVKAMREVIKRATQLHDMNVDELSRAIRPMVGLDWRQAIANENYYLKMIENGVKPKVALDKSIRYSARQNRYRAYRIARTELGFAYNQGSYYGTKQAQAQGLLGRVEKVWCTADDYYADGSHRVCDICRSLDGKPIDIDDDFDFKTKLIEPGIKRVPPAHPHCLIPGTKVSAGDIIGGSVRRFEGTVITLRTSTGSELSVTPNHPILTDRGFIAAGELNEGDKVVETFDIDRIMNVLEADNYNIPTAVEEITNSLLMNGSVMANAVPITAKDFHGDGINGDVGIIWSNSFLPSDIKSGGNEGVSKVDFGRRGMGIVNIPFVVDGSSNLGFNGDNSTSNSIVSGRSDGKSLFMGHFGHSDKICFTSASDFQTFVFENAFCSCPSDAKLIGNSKNRSSRMVCGYDIIPDSGMFKAIPVFLMDGRELAESSIDSEPIIDSGYRDVELIRNLFNSEPGTIHFSSIVKIDREFSNTHVYNLQTKSGVYVANNIITHNCRCTVLYKEIEPPIQAVTTPIIIQQ